MFGYAFPEFVAAIVLMFIAFIAGAVDLVLCLMKGGTMFKSAWYEVKEEENQAVDPNKVAANEKRAKQLSFLRRVFGGVLLVCAVLAIILLCTGKEKFSAVDVAKETEIGMVINDCVEDLTWDSAKRSNGSTYVVAKFELADGTEVAQYFEYYTDDEYIYVQASDLMLDGHIADYDGMMWFYEDLYYTISDPYYYD